MLSLVLMLSICLIACNCNQITEREQNLNETVSTVSGEFTKKLDSTAKGVDINLNISITSLVVIILIIGVCVGFALGGGCGICLGMLMASQQPEYPEKDDQATAVSMEEDPGQNNQSAANSGGAHTNASNAPNLKSQI